MRRGFLVLLLFGVGIPLTASGCGEGDSAGDTTASISKAQFVKQANAICAKTNRELVDSSEEFLNTKILRESKSLTKAQVIALSKLALPPITEQVEELRALGAPAGDEGKVDAILSAAEEAIEKGERDPAAIYGADGGAFAKANQLSSAYGLEKCSE
jgi:hypothetical protein